MTAIEFVLKEFNSISNLSEAVWLRKMEEYAVLQNKAVNLEGILSLSKNEKAALSAAVSALYFDKNIEDYQHHCFLVIYHLARIEIELLDEKMIDALFKLLNTYPHNLDN